MNRFAFRVAAVAIAVFAFVGMAVADSNILFILDGSGSMYGKVGNESKIVVAKRELIKLVSQLPAGAQMALMTYGATSKSSCGDIQLLVPFGTESDPSVIEDIKPLGKTPIAAALAQSAAAFAGLEGQNNNVVLVSDGIESCDGDPCDAATKLAKSGIGVRVDVVGFGLTKEESDALKCIADNGNGKYFPANDTSGFADAIKSAVDVAQTNVVLPPVPEPQKPADTVVFEDTFDGAELNSSNWQVINSVPDSYLVEGGALLMVSSAVGGIANPDIPNVFKYSSALPSGDYEVEVGLRVEFATGKEQFQFGLYDDISNYLTASLVSNANCCNSTIDLRIDKVAGGQPTSFNVAAIKLPSQDAFSKEANATGQPITLKLIKQGHNYRASVSFAGLKDESGNPVVVTTDPVTSLRAPKSLVMNLSQGSDVGGETTAYVDDVKISTQSK